MRRFEGRTAVVVHVGSLLGRACAHRLASEGAELIVVDPLVESADRVAEELRALGTIAEGLTAPFGDETAIADVVAAVAKRHPKIDVLVVTAGALDWWPIGADSMEYWEASFRINLLTPVFYARAFRGLLARSGDAAIVIYGSIDGLRGNPRIPAYSAARGALVPFVHTEAHVVAPLGIRVNLIAGAGILPEGPEAPVSRGAAIDSEVALRETPLGRFAEAAEVAGTVAFLASVDAAYLTGAVITLDGGRTAITPATGLNWGTDVRKP